ncbi:MAG: hypothetical protein HC895_16295 [Leptolyngbyaceae cyanobacterium SM1_3_5]|nr:hypothetical protein [Leptolyngbyaceae cyanobacterium SM1_3_5]
MPLQFQLDYAPKESGLVGGSFGLQTTLPTALPVTLRLLPGLKTGLMNSPAAGSAPASTVPVFGASIGLGAGLELKPGIKLQLDAQHFQNFLDKGPKGVQSVVLGASFNL